MILPVSPLEWGRIAFVAIVVALASFLLGQCDGRNTERAKSNAARAEANVEALKTESAAVALAAEERLEDAAVVTRDEKELVDAIQSTPDTAPDAVRVQLGCQRLRAQGTAEADLPPACGPAR